LRALVTDSAKQQIGELLEKPDLAQDAASLLARLQALTTDPGVSLNDPAVVSLSRGSEGRVYVVRSGQMRALVTIDANAPDRLLVASIYRAGDNESADMRDALSRSADIIHAQ
jgi:hypothetical protein